MALQIDNLELRVVSGGQLWVDGGTMFGVVPKVLWQRHHPSDEQNRILLQTNCLLIRGGGRTVLVDTGFGCKLSDRERTFVNAAPGNPLIDNLGAAGVAPTDVDTVILTHLHFDHAGGSTEMRDDNKLHSVFPKARHIVQRAEWEDAVSGAPELRDAYFSRDFVPLEEAGQVDLIHGDAEVLPCVSVRRTIGHTRGHQVVEIGSGERRALYLGDLCPSVAHLRAQWSMAYDLFPIDVRRVKPQVIGNAVDRGWLIIFGHDPVTRAAYLQRDPKGHFVVREAVEL